MKKEDLKNELLQNKVVKALEDDMLEEVSGGVQNPMSNPMSNCPDCGASIPPTRGTCPKCGWPHLG